MTKVECTLLTCVHNDKSLHRCGVCTLDTIYMKWRFAADMGKGNIVYMECLNFTLPEGE